MVKTKLKTKNLRWSLWAAATCCRYVVFGGLLSVYDDVYVCQVSADWERASLRPSIQPSSGFKPSPVMETYTTEGSFINTNLVTADEESQEFDDLIFALKTGEIYSTLNKLTHISSFILSLRTSCCFSSAWVMSILTVMFNLQQLHTGFSLTRRVGVNFNTDWTEVNTNRRKAI